MVADGKGIRRIARDMKIPVSTTWRWVHRYKHDDGQPHIKNQWYPKHSSSAQNSTVWMTKKTNKQLLKDLEQAALGCEFVQRLEIVLENEGGNIED